MITGAVAATVGHATPAKRAIMPNNPTEELKMSLPNISIFTVFLWRDTGDNYILDLHLVAGFDSADAERRIKASSIEHIRQEGATCFITTDDNVSNHYDPAVRLYVNGGTKENISKDQYLRWVQTMTRGFYLDGEKHSANVRPI